MEDFQEPLFACNKTPGLFCFLTVFSCVGGPCCVQGKVVSEYTKKGCMYHCALPCFLLCIGASLNRQHLREKLGMPRLCLQDCLLHLLCNICAVNQEFLESHKRLAKGNFTLMSIIGNSKEGAKRSFTPSAPVYTNLN